MIITREIEIKINESNYQYYEDLGYDILIGEIITIPVELLPNGSHYKVKCKCDGCGIEKEVIYKNYLKYDNKNWGDYSCRKCSEIKRKETLRKNFGVDYPIQNKKVLSKMKKTLLIIGGEDGMHRGDKILKKIINNIENMGHGPSTLIGMLKASEMNYDVIVTADGDGHYQVLDLKAIANQLFSSDVDLVEGVRTLRTDPWFRKISSLITRNLVRIRSRKAVIDANTPIRAYRPTVLRKILLTIPTMNYLIPNLYISALSRKLDLKIDYFTVETRERQSSASLGTTWKQKYRNVPTKKYLKFCLNATFQWFFKK
jgi:hypothetical protein